ncbi:MAG: serpin family protein [Clostridiaceae bacterium]|nr:serpin family protein [Clostridiaceae bacterium]
MKIKGLFALVLILSLAFASCADIPGSNTTGESPDITGPGIIEQNGNDMENEDGEDEKKPVDDQKTPDEAGEITSGGEKNTELILANRKFSWEIFKKINEEDSKKDIFISPLSISTMLTMALNGAKGTTKEAIENALFVHGMDIDKINRGYAWLIDRLNGIDEKIKLDIANSIWIRDGFDVKPDFIERNRRYLNSEVRVLDFSKADAAGTINNWISQKTNNLITGMIDPPIPDDVMMYLINAIYFKGEWAEQFNEENTSKQDFHAIDGKTDKVLMMRRTGRVDYVSTDDYRAVSLPYGNKKTSMIIILPDMDINEFISGMDNEKFGELLDGLRPVSDLNLQIPKFKMEYGIKELNDTLEAMGMGVALSHDADFTGIADELFISRVLHKAVIDVNEEGTEAAAATVGEMKTTAVVEPVSFIADRPFLFVIADIEEGNILFIGKKAYGDR